MTRRGATTKRAKKPAGPPPDPVASARDAALKLLAGQDLSRHEIEAQLARKHKPEHVLFALDNLAQLGLLDDRRAARSHIRQRLSEGAAARALLQHELETRGIDPGVIEEVLDESFSTRDESRDALALARERIRTAPARLAPEAILRRTFAYLARRGYDEEAARQAVETAGEEYLGRP